MQAVAKLSAKHQIVIPRDVRRHFKLQAGDNLLVEVEGNTIVLFPLPRNYTKHLEGLHKHVWKGVDVAAYIREERKAAASPLCPGNASHPRRVGGGKPPRGHVGPCGFPVAGG